LDEADLAASLRAARTVFRSFGSELQVETRAPIESRHIALVEERLEFAFPPSYRSFLAIHDGLKLAVELPLPHGYSSQSIIEILGAEALASQTALLSDAIGDESDWQRLYAFASYGDGNYCGFDAHAETAGECPVVDIFHEDPTTWRKPIADTFDDWISRIFQAVIDQHEFFTFWLPPEDLKTMLAPH
jgi:hypothetical protein